MRPFALTAVLCLACFGPIPSARAQTEAEVEIKLKNGTALEGEGREQLERLLCEYHLDPWVHTREVMIESYVVPHSHPILTLNTRYLDDDEWQLSTFVHEQAHWFVSGRDEAEREVMTALRQSYPDVPVGSPDGARSERSTYLHLIVCWLELDAMTELVGEEAARNLLARKPYYRWVYEQVLSNTEDLGALLADHDLLIRSRG